MIGLDAEDPQGQLGRIHRTPELLMGQRQVGEGGKRLWCLGVDQLDGAGEQLDGLLGP